MRQVICQDFQMLFGISAQNRSVFIRINEPTNKDNSVFSVFQQILFTKNTMIKAAL